MSFGFVPSAWLCVHLSRGRLKFFRIYLEMFLSYQILLWLENRRDVWHTWKKGILTCFSGNVNGRVFLEDRRRWEFIVKSDNNVKGCGPS